MQHEAEPTSLLSDSACCNTHTIAAERSEPHRCGEVRDETLDLTAYIREGQVVLNLGSGDGKFCYQAARIVGRQGRVIGVECDDTPLALARSQHSEIAAGLGYSNIEFRKGRLHDLRLDLDLLDAWLQVHPARTSNDWLRTENHAHQMRLQAPMIASEVVDTVICDGVINGVAHAHRPEMLAEILRVLKRGGRAVINEIISDEDAPQALDNDSPLESSLLSGAYREDLLIEAFEAAGFHGMEIVQRQVEPRATIAGIEYRSVTIQAFKGKAGPCLDRKQAVIYNGPWKAVVDDDGHTLFRGKRMAVCDKTFNLYCQAPYAEEITPIPPAQDIPLAQAKPFDCSVNAIRDPRETKGTTALSSLSLLPLSEGCGPQGCC